MYHQDTAQFSALFSAISDVSRTPVSPIECSEVSMKKKFGTICALFAASLFCSPAAHAASLLSETLTVLTAWSLSPSTACTVKGMRCGLPSIRRYWV